MAKTLVIKDADFSNNALDQVVIGTIPCTGIELDKSTISIVNTGNTDTLIATVTPEDTTQQVIWTSSNNNVVTVENGVITAVGVGSATITVTCGSYSDTCVVTVTEFMNKADLMKMSGAYVNSSNALSAGGSGITTIQASSTYAKYGTLASKTGNKYANDFSSNHFYPYKMPKNTKRIKIIDTGTSGIKKQSVLWYNSETPASTAGYENYCGVLGDTALYNISDSPYIVDVPTFTDLPAVDSMIIFFRTYKTGTTFADSDFDDVSIEFLPEETT